MGAITRDEVREILEEIIKEQSQINTTGDANTDQHTQCVESGGSALKGE